MAEKKAMRAEVVYKEKEAEKLKRYKILEMWGNI